MKPDDPNDVIPTAAQARRDKQDTYRREILDEIEKAENALFTAAYRLRQSEYNDDPHADQAHIIAAEANALRIELGGEE